MSTTLLADNCPNLRARFVADISRRFPTEDKGELEWILNTAITRNRAARSLTLSQGLYTADLIAKFESYFDRSRSRHFDSPIEEGLELSPADQPVLGSVEYDEMSKFRDAYMAIVGGLLWLANMTRVDIAYSASQLARFMTNPGPSHFKAAIRVLVYLRDTADRALVMMRPGCGCARARAVIQLVSKELMRPYCAVAELGFSNRGGAEPGGRPRRPTH